MASLFLSDGEKICDVDQIEIHGPITPEGVAFTAGVPSTAAFELANHRGSLLVETDEGNRYLASIEHVYTTGFTGAEVKGRLRTRDRQPG